MRKRALYATLLVLAVVVGVGTLVFTSAHNRRSSSNCPRPQIAGPAITTIPIDEQPYSLDVGLGSVWVLRTTADESVTVLVQIDPSTHEQVGKAIDVGSPAVALAIGKGSVWVVTRPTVDGSNRNGTLLRVDPSTHRIVGRIPVGREPIGVTVGEGAVWVTNARDNTVTRVDPHAERAIATIKVGHRPERIVAGGGAVWVNTQDGLVRINPAANRVISTIRTLDILAVSADNVWVESPASPNGAIQRLDTETNEAVGPFYPVDITPVRVVEDDDGYLWIAKWFFYCKQHFPVPEGPPIVFFELIRIDPVTMQPLGEPIPIGSAPEPLVIGEGALWTLNPFPGQLVRVDRAVASGSTSG